MSPRWTPRSTTTCAAEGRDEAEREAAKERARAIEARRAATAAAAGAAVAKKGTGHRLPDLSGLPPLLVRTGSFESLRERLGPAGRRGDEARARPARRPDVRARTAPSRTSPPRSPWPPRANGSCWIARDAEIGDRVAEELGAWLGDPTAVVVLEPRTALAYERSELVADETAARVAALAAWRSGRARIMVAGVQALLQHTIAPDDLPASPREIAPGARLHQDALLHDLFDLGYSPVTEVAGRGEFARRGGIVDVFPPSMPLPIRIEFFGDEIDSLRAFDPTDQRTVQTVDRIVLLPASEFLLPVGGGAAIRERLGRLAARLPERLAADLARFEGDGPGDAARPRRPQRSRRPPVPARPGPSRSAMPPRSGRPSSRRRPAWTTSAPGTLLLLDEPGDIAEAAEFLWRQADERRAELIAADDLPKDWPSTYLPPRDWKGRLVASRTLELTWESEPPEGAAMAAGRLSSGDLFGWREPGLPLGRAARLPDAVTTWASEGARIVLASDQSARLADILGEAGHPVGVVQRIVDPPPTGAIVLVERSLNGGFEGGPDGLVVVTDRELFGTVRVRRPRALRRVVPRDILERLTPGDLVVHIDHGVARYEQMLRRGGTDEDRDYLELSFAGGDRIYVPVEQIARVTRYAGGERPALSKLGGTEWLRSKQRVRKAVAELAEELLQLYAARAGARGHAFALGHALADGDGGLVPVRGDRRPAAGRGRGQGRHGAGPADGPARRRRRGLRQDRGRAAGRLQGDPGRQAGRRAGADDRARRPAPGDLQPALRRVPARGPAAVADGLGQGAGRDRGRAGGRHGGRRHRHAPAAQQGHRVQGPRARRRRRGAAVRRRGQGAAQAAPQRGGRPDPVGDADPADAQPGPGRDPRPVGDRDAARGPAADPDPGRGGVGRARPRRDPARARPRRAGLLRPQPRRDDRSPGRATATDAARARGSSSGTAR